nr:GGDEF domain-containing protein [Tissierella sp.]
MTKNTTEITNHIILKTLMDNSQDTIYFKDKDSKIIVSSRAHSLLWGETNPDDVIGKTDFDYFPYEFAMESLKDEREIMETGIPKTGIIERLVQDDGEVKWLSASKYPLFDEKKNIIGTWGTSRDVSSLKKAEKKLIALNEKLHDAYAELKLLSSKDSLSGLYNQGHFFEEINERFELNKRRKEKATVKGFSLILFDIDDFKSINDKHGHLMGDFAIRYIAELVRSYVRISDLCFRYGGDEFAVILTDTNLNEARRVAEGLREKIHLTSIISGHEELKVTISAGTSTFNEVDDVNEMIKLADERLYCSKNKGKNRVS